MNSDKRKRVMIVNQIIQEIANSGRRFFCYKGRYARMIIENNKVFFIDDYTLKKVYAYNTVPNEHRGFSHGGTIWSLINDFREFIQTGEHTNGNNGYGGLHCRHWGYPEEDMKSIRYIARKLGYLKEGAES